MKFFHLMVIIAMLAAGIAFLVGTSADAQTIQLTPPVVDWSEAVLTHHAWTPDIDPSLVPSPPTDFPLTDTETPDPARNSVLKHPLTPCR